MANTLFSVLALTNARFDPTSYQRDGIHLMTERDARNALKRTTDQGHPFQALVVDLDYLADGARNFLRNFTARPKVDHIPLILIGQNVSEAQNAAEEFDAYPLTNLSPRPLQALLHRLAGTSSSRGFTRGLVEA